MMKCPYCYTPIEAAHPHDGFTACVKSLGEMTSLLVKRVNRAEHAIASAKAAADFKEYDERVKAREPAVLRVIGQRGVVLDYIAAIFEFAEAADTYVIVQRRHVEIIVSAAKA